MARLVQSLALGALLVSTLLIPILFLGYVAIQVALSRKTSGERKLGPEISSTFASAVEYYLAASKK